jgi:holin-like protein
LVLHLTILLAFQLAGEVIARGLGLPLPGPVIGMALLFAALVALPRLAPAITPTARGLLAHLSLLFVPAGVGVVGHLDRLGSDGAALMVAIVGSTVLAMVAAALTFVAVARLTEVRR